MERQLVAYYRQHRLERFVRAKQLDQFRIHRFAQGEQIFDLEQPMAFLHFLVEGRAKVFVPVENARQLLLCIYEPLQLLGDVEVFEQTPLATTSVAALTPCVCLSLPHSFVVSELATDPVFLKELNVSLGSKLRRVISNSALNLLHPLESRVASYILATATLHDQQLVFGGNLTQIAELLGTSFRHLHRTLRGLCEEGILLKVKAGYIVEQRDALERRAAGAYVMPSLL